jgi:hypothetical protein
MESNYSSKYSGEQVDAAVEYYLNHSQIEDSSSYEYTNVIFCESTSVPSKPFKDSDLPLLLPSLPFAGIDGNLWYDIPNTSSSNWYQCVLKINYKSKKVVSQGEVLYLKGDKGDQGDKGNNGSNGSSGTDGNDGSNGNYTEFRYKRSSQYAITLTDVQKNSRFPEGWNPYWDDADVEDYDTIKRNLGTAFDTFLNGYSSNQLISDDSESYFTNLDSNATFTQLNDQYNLLHSNTLIATETQKATILEAFKSFIALYASCEEETIDELECNTEYHKLYTKYIDEDHFWLLFMIYAVIDGNTNTLIGEWSNPQRIQGEDGKAGPKGSNGIDGIAGVNIGIAFTLGTESNIREDAVNPTESPYNVNYKTLFTNGTKWFKYTPAITAQYPYIWFTQCRYNISKDAEGNEIYVFEDSWSIPARYTGLNGINTTETVYVKNPIIYPQGLYTAGTTYTNDGSRTPYVYYDGYYYYLSGQGSWMGSDLSTPANNSEWWTLLEGFEALYTKVGIIANGLIGSAVFNGDYMFSQQGVDQNGTASTHYEKFLQNYSTGDILVNPYDDMAAFKPNFCINFKTGEQWSTSVDSAIEGAKSEVIQAATIISMSVQETIEGNLKSAGIDITSDGVKVTGTFSGTSDGTFNGDVAAKSLSVLGEDGTPAMVFATYKASMGTPSGGTAPDEGTPVLLINYGGNQYLVSMLKLVTGSSTGQYKQTKATTESLYTTTSILPKLGKQGSANYSKITKAPYLTLVDNSGNETNTTIVAKLYNSNDEEVNWSSYLNKYYEGELITEYSSKTDLGSGIWAFKVTGNFATVANIYNGTPTTKFMAVVAPVNNVMCYRGATSAVYNKISIVSGVLRSNTYNVVTSYVIKSNGTNLVQDSSATQYLKLTSTTANYLNASGTSTTSSYFAISSTSASEITSEDINKCVSIVGPQSDTTIDTIS